MRLLQKWNFETHEYEVFQSPAENIVFVTDDMKAKTDCANCGKTITVGKGFTSLCIHTGAGLGFTVCGKCYKAEEKAREAAKE